MKKTQPRNTLKQLVCFIGAREGGTNTEDSLRGEAGMGPRVAEEHQGPRRGMYGAPHFPRCREGAGMGALGQGFPESLYFCS